MASLPKVDTNYLTKFLVDLLNIPLPAGRTDDAIAFVEKELSTFKQLKLSRARKGAPAIETTWILACLLSK